MKKTQYTLEDIEKSTAPISDAWYGADDLYVPLCDDWYVPLCDAWYGAGDAWYGAGADDLYDDLCADECYGAGADECYGAGADECYGAGADECYGAGADDLYDDLCDDENENEDAEEEAVEDVDDVTIRLSDMDGDATQILFEFAVEVTADVFGDEYDSCRRRDFLHGLHCALCHHAYLCADRFPDDSMTCQYYDDKIRVCVTENDGNELPEGSCEMTKIIDLSKKQNTYIFG